MTVKQKTLSHAQNTLIAVDVYDVDTQDWRPKMSHDMWNDYTNPLCRECGRQKTREEIDNDQEYCDSCEDYYISIDGGQ